MSIQVLKNEFLLGWRSFLEPGEKLGICLGKTLYHHAKLRVGALEIFHYLFFYLIIKGISGKFGQKIEDGFFKRFIISMVVFVTPAAKFIISSNLNIPG